MSETCGRQTLFPVVAPDSVRTTIPACGEVREGIWIFTAPLGEHSLRSGKLQLAEKLLSQEEIARANSFAFSILRDNYVFSHALLRVLLSAFAGKKTPDEICFLRNPWGKPYLADNTSGLHFSMSHSGSMVLIALALTGSLGADIEPFSLARDNACVADMCFSPGELEAFRSAPCPARFFYHVWTRKEATLKAAGVGLVDDLDALDVISGKPLYRKKSTGHSCISLALDPDHAAALAFAELPSAPAFNVCPLGELPALF
jgi:4'-phosphopantetheinyl transferase